MQNSNGVLPIANKRKVETKHNSRRVGGRVRRGDDRKQVPAVARVRARVPHGQADAGVLLDVAQGDGGRPGPAGVELRREFFLLYFFLSENVREREKEERELSSPFLSVLPLLPP